MSDMNNPDSVAIFSLLDGGEALVERLSKQIASVHRMRAVWCEAQMLERPKLPSSFNGAIFIGGDPPTSFQMVPGVCNVAQDFDAFRMPVGAVGAGVLLLARAGLVVGKEVSASVEMTRRLAGLGAICCAQPVVKSGWLVTGAKLDALSHVTDLVCEMAKGSLSVGFQTREDVDDQSEDLL
jgi:putative intracellular protease/amidase